MRRFVLLSVFMFIGVRAVSGMEENTLTPQEIAAGWKLLFNGRNLDGWHVYGKPGESISTWHVENGTIALSKTNGRPGAGDLVSDLKFHDFEFSFEWRIGTGGNSGVHFLFDEHRPGTDVKMYAGDKGNAPIGLEYQLLDDEHHPDAKNGPLRQTASIYALVPSVGRENKSVGEFNSSRIRLQARHVEHWLNGKKVAEADLDSEAFKNAIAKSKFKDIPNFVAMRSTALALQDHGEEVAFRDLKIRELNSAAVPAGDAAPAAAIDARLALPDDSQKHAAEALMHDVFKAEFAQTLPAQKQALARKLGAQALDAHESAAGRYVLLRESIALSVQTGDVEAALRASEQLARLFTVDSLTTRLETLTQLMPNATPENAPALARECLDILDREAANENFDVALSVIPIAQAAVHRAKDPRLAAQTETAAQHVREMNEEFKKAKAARHTLDGGIYNEAAHLAVGRYLCFFRNDWSEGIPHLAEGNDPALKELALKELGKPTETAAQLGLSDGWLNLAKTEKLSAQLAGACNARALVWCERALASSTGGLLKLKAEKRLAELKALENSASIPSRHGNRIDALALIDLSKNVVSGEWQRKDAGLAVAKGFAARVEIPYRPPQEYDFKIVFTCETAPAQVCQILSEDGHPFAWIMGANKGQFTAIETIAGANASNNPTTIKQKQSLEVGHQYTSLVEVRKDRVRAFLDGKMLVEWKTDFKDLGIVSNWKPRNPEMLGFGAHMTATVFHSAEVIEVTGRGEAVR